MPLCCTSSSKRWQRSSSYTWRATWQWCKLKWLFVCSNSLGERKGEEALPAKPSYHDNVSFSLPFHLPFVFYFYFRIFLPFHCVPPPHRRQSGKCGMFPFGKWQHLAAMAIDWPVSRVSRTTSSTASTGRKILKLLHIIWFCCGAIRRLLLLDFIAMTSGMKEDISS